MLDVDDATFIVGICQKMCPAPEIKFRERHNLLHRFEQVLGTENLPYPRANRSFMVKEYSRSAAGKQAPRPEDIRPPSVLLKTVDFLLRNICTRNDVHWSVVYEFVFDRLRAVRQDMVVQNAVNIDTVKILERVVRFHLYASYKLLEANPAQFDAHINNTHIQECMKRLINMYEEADCSCRKWEFLSLYLLFNIDSNDALQFCLNNKLKHKATEEFNTVLRLCFAWRDNNCVRVLTLCKQLSAMNLCAFHRHISTCRTKFLKRLNFAYSSKTHLFPLDTLTALLALDSEDACRVLCEQCGLQVLDSGVRFVKTSDNNVTLRSPQKEEWMTEVIEQDDRPLYELLTGSSCDHC